MTAGVDRSTETRATQAELSRLNDFLESEAYQGIKEIYKLRVEILRNQLEAGVKIVEKDGVPEEVPLTEIDEAKLRGRLAENRYYQQMPELLAKQLEGVLVASMEKEAQDG